MSVDMSWGMVESIAKMGTKEYTQLLKAANSTIEFALRKFGAQRYEWIDKYEKEDIAEDALEKAMNTFKANGGSSFKSWLQMIAFQVTADRLDKHRETEGLTYVTEDGDEIEISDCATCETPEDVVIGWETQELIERELESKSEVDRMVYDLHVQGFKPREIADQFGITSNNVSVKIDRLKKAVDLALAA